MTVTRGLGLAPDPVRWDWYSGSLVDSVDSGLVVSVLSASLDADPKLGVPRHGYQRCVQLARGEHVVAQVMSGGSHETPYVQASGSSSGFVAKVLRANWTHRVSRVDACVDFDAEGAWEAVLGQVLTVTRQRGISKRQAGDWIDPHQRPGDGRTLYAGGQSSAVQGRFYEKGRQLPDAGRPYWVRGEIQIRPAKAAKRAMALVDPRGAWGASAWSADVLERLTGDAVPPARVVNYVEPDNHRRYLAMLRQYGRTLDLVAEQYGGDWSQLGLVLRDDLAASRRSSH